MYKISRSNVELCMNNSYITDTIPIQDIIRVEQDEKYTLMKYRKHETKQLTTLDAEGMEHLKKQGFRGDILGGELVNFRSLIFDRECKRLLSFTPPKSTVIQTDNVTYEEFVEGTMVSVFHDGNTWEIATRSIVGGRNTFYKDQQISKTFRTMFLEAMTNDLVEFEMLNEEYCYTFILQHPYNRVVVPFCKTSLYLVAVYEIWNTDDKEIIIKEIPCDKIRDTHEELCKRVKFPEKYEGTREEIEQKYCSEEAPYNIVGVMIKSGNQRDKMRNPVYERVRHLRGNQPKQQYQYLTLRKEGRVHELLKYFPELKKKCSIWRNQVHSFTSSLHTNYLKVFVLHETPLENTPFELRPHIVKLHEMYIHELKPKDERVTRHKVIEYVNSLHPSQMLFAINTPIRKQHKDLLVRDFKK